MSLSLKGLQRVALHLLCLVPVLWLFTLAATDGLGANPAEALLRDLGLWALRFVCLALAVTPLRVWLGWTRLAAYRRMLGLYAFFYGNLHWLCYLLLDMGLDWAAVLEDLAKRPFILVGTLAWGILLVLAVTSIPRLIRRMGGKRWQALHRAVYAAAALAVLHFWWMRAGKNNLAEVGIYLAIVAVLLLARVLHRYTKGRRISHPRQPAR
ncbi:sulfite oxidase heme-binding subunit YedZ [Comamonas aquatica]|uniref:sulfite oxidase heme-binding subunit YedZ n=1 Tax=Comamonas aquatica TaxID=225991 RepID=UPI001B394939|nr:protein-methionine-sulfoxide reductase heme-binding subunit MsrQ [Comamonas aquatica]QTX21141.1 sulfoxide reductase heme-binding subunit YedZ [Comamonas aquatica]